MFKFPFGNNANNINNTNKIFRELIKVLKNGINININISGDLHEPQRRNTMEEESELKGKIQPQSEVKSPRQPIESEEETIPNFSRSRFAIPEVGFGEEVQDKE